MINMKTFALILLIVSVISFAHADSATVGVSASGIQICSQGELRADQSNNTIFECQNNIWTIIQDCKATNQIVWISNSDGIPRCVDKAPSGFNPWILVSILLIITLVIFIILLARKKSSKRR